MGKVCLLIGGIFLNIHDNKPIDFFFFFLPRLLEPWRFHPPSMVSTRTTICSWMETIQ